MNMDLTVLQSQLAKHGQEHVLTFLDSLNDKQKRELYADLSDLDFDKVTKCWQEAQQKLAETQEKKDEYLQPLDRSIVGSTARDKTAVPKWEDIGMEKVAKNQVAVLLLAGGQGTRLGAAYPKGMYDVGLPSKKTLYQLQAERILKLQRLAGEKHNCQCTIPWYIMTSEHTKEPTVAFFEKHSYFGLNPSNVVVFEQNTLPCLDFNGKIILGECHRVARSPDGNGGLYSALGHPSNGVLADMEDRGVQFMHVYCVDNILVKMADPVFIGFCVEKQAECGAKVVKKVFPTEKVGVVCCYNNHYQVVEYSELSVATAEKRDPDGSLTFDAGNICNHFFTRNFLSRVCTDHVDELCHHIAKKKIPHVNNEGLKVVPTNPNGIKLEKFVFDVFQFARSFAVLEVLREDEFSPLKNGPGSDKDTPATARSALLDLHYRQILAAGGVVTDNQGKKIPLIPPRESTSDMSIEGEVVCEISPLISYCGEGLKELCNGQTFKPPLHLELEDTDSNGSCSPEVKRPRTE